jgi:hypothetical protein
MIEPVAETFYKLMRQIYVEQVWRQNERERRIRPQIEGRPNYETYGPPFSH